MGDFCEKVSSMGFILDGNFKHAWRKICLSEDNDFPICDCSRSIEYNTSNIRDCSLRAHLILSYHGSFVDCIRTPYPKSLPLEKSYVRAFTHALIQDPTKEGPKWLLCILYTWLYMETQSVQEVLSNFRSILFKNGQDFVEMQ